MKILSYNVFNVFISKKRISFGAHFCALFARQKRSDAPTYCHVLLSCGPAATLTPDLVGIGAIRRGRSSLPVTFVFEGAPLVIFCLTKSWQGPLNYTLSCRPGRGKVQV